MKKSLPMKERITVTRRGFLLLNSYCPGLLKDKTLYAFAAAIQPLASIWISAQIINELTETRRIPVLFGYVAAVIGTNFIAQLLKNVLNKAAAEKEAQMWNFFEKIFSDKAMSLDYADLEKDQVQQARKEAHENLFLFGNGLGELVWSTTGLVSSTVQILTAASLVITLFSSASGNTVMDSPLWILAVLFFIVLGGYANSRATHRENHLFERWCKDSVWFYRSFSFYSQELSMSLERAKDVRIYEQEEAARRAFQYMTAKDREDAGAIFQMSLYPALARVVIGVGNSFCWVYVAVKAFLGAYGAGSIVQYIGALERLGAGIQDILFQITDNAVACTHLKGLFAYLDIPNHKYNGTLPVEKRAFCDHGDMDYEIEFHNVSFRYPGAKQDSLKHVSLKFRIGERLAVVGMNGSGKTTFIKLLCRLYDPTEGEILLNGIDIRMYDYEEYLSLFSVVFQDFRLFSFPLGQNVATDTDFDPEKAERCLDRAGFRERLSHLPDGLATCLYKDFDANGVEISGGEAQKIALARALYKDAPFMILDEPTAALDPVAEAEIYASFNDIMGGKTAIYISHRLSSCKFCDEIVVFHEGAIIQRGSHNELVADVTGKYYELWHAQAQYYTADTL